MSEKEIYETASMQGVPKMKVQASQYFTLKIYLHRRRRPLELAGLTQEQVDNFNANATSKMFVKYGPVLIRGEAIDYIVVTPSR